MTTGFFTSAENFTVYRCPNCHKRYRRFFESYSCCVNHGPSDCCHVMEQRVTKKGWPK